MIKKGIIGVVVVFAFMQFFSSDLSNPKVIEGSDFIEFTNTPENVAKILVASCYDCHSNQTVYPWYSSVAPISWWLNNHITEGREELNFSEWASFPMKRKAKKLKEIIEEVEEGEMPLSSYCITHPSAKLSGPQKKELLNWVKYLQMSSK